MRYNEILPRVFSDNSSASCVHPVLNVLDLNEGWVELATNEDEACSALSNFEVYPSGCATGAGRDIVSASMTGRPSTTSTV